MIFLGSKALEDNTQGVVDNILFLEGKLLFSVDSTLSWEGNMALGNMKFVGNYHTFFVQTSGFNKRFTYLFF